VKPLLKLNALAGTVPWALEMPVKPATMVRAATVVVAALTKRLLRVTILIFPLCRWESGPVTASSTVPTPARYVG
jgi:hypothetical protein